MVQPPSCGGGGGGTGTSPYGSCVLLLLLHPSPVHWLLVEQLFCHLFFALGGGGGGGGGGGAPGCATISSSVCRSYSFC